MDYTLETDKHVGVVVLTNGESDDGRNAIWDALYNFSNTIPTDVARDLTTFPEQYYLSQNYPNPFNPVTNFQFSIVNRQLTTLKVYDVLGREVATLVNEVKQPGTYTVQWNASGVASGVYFYRMSAASFVDVKKLILVR